MGFNILDVVNAATRAEVGENKDYREINLDYRDIVVTEHNNCLLYTSDAADDR